MALLDNDWTTLAANLYEDVSRRWVAAWGFYLGDYAKLVAGSPLTRSLIAESIARSYDISRDRVVDFSTVPEGLNFEFDRATQATGPRFTTLANSTWTPQNPPKLTGVGLGLDTLHGGQKKCPPGELTNLNVKVRVENGLLSVTLVGLGDVRKAQGVPPTSSTRKSVSRRTRPLVTPSSTRAVFVDYHLHFEGDHDPVTLAASRLK